MKFQYLYNGAGFSFFCQFECFQIKNTEGNIARMNYKFKQNKPMPQFSVSRKRDISVSRTGFLHILFFLRRECWTLNKKTAAML
jgi:hypothetical protein